MTKLTPAQIGQYAAGAGFTGKGLTRAIAVALAESGGDPRVISAPNRDRWHSRDRGLWQINDHWHPEVSTAAALDPAKAAAAAYRISSGGRDWSQWSTWNNGAAQAQLGRAQMGANQAAATGATTTAQNVDYLPNLPNGLDPFLGAPGLLDLFGGKDGIGGGIKNTADAIKAALLLAVKAGAWMADAHNWSRVAMVAGGGVGILLALEMIAKSGAAGSTAESVAAIPGKAAGLATQAAAAVATDGASVAAKAAK